VPANNSANSARTVSEPPIVGTPKRLLLVLGFLLSTWCADASKQGDALTVLTAVGYLTAAADVCRVAPQVSGAMQDVCALAIRSGAHGDQVEARRTYDTARRAGASDAIDKKVDCAKFETTLRAYAKSL